MAVSLGLPRCPCAGLVERRMMRSSVLLLVRWRRGELGAECCKAAGQRAPCAAKLLQEEVPHKLIIQPHWPAVEIVGSSSSSGKRHPIQLLPPGSGSGMWTPRAGGSGVSNAV